MREADYIPIPIQTPPFSLTLTEVSAQTLNQLIFSKAAQSSNFHSGGAAGRDALEMSSVLKGKASCYKMRITVNV